MKIGDMKLFDVDFKRREALLNLSYLFDAGLKCQKYMDSLLASSASFNLKPFVTLLKSPVRTE